MVVVAVAAAGGASLLSASPAVSDPWGGSGTEDTGPTPDNNPQAYCFGANMNVWMRTFTHESMNGTDANTDVEAQWDATCNWSLGSATDMHVIESTAIITRVT